MRKSFIGLLIFILFISCDFFYSDKEGRTEVSWLDFRGIENLELKGVVYSLNDKIGNGYHGRGIVRVNIIESNMDFYDPREKQANYYCLIKKGKAEIYDTHVSSFKIGDTIIIDSKNKLLYFSQNGKFKPTSMSIGPPRFFNMIKTKGYQEF
tara:strand:- start:400 stop:855 length:456 start_codon:yes stop_codon:yes gene_type:complete